MQEDSYKRFYRTSSDKRIAGVCGGIAQYLNVDSTIVRIVFLVAFLAGFVSLWVYIIVWLVAPEDNLLN